MLWYHFYTSDFIKSLANLVLHLFWNQAICIKNNLTFTSYFEEFSALSNYLIFQLQAVKKKKVTTIQHEREKEPK